MNGIHEYGFETGFESRPYAEMRDFQNRNRFIYETIQLRKPSFKDLNAVQYLSSVESNIPDELISTQNFTEIKKLASHFTRGITSFFGFESRLNSPDARADYLFAVSSQKGEREALANLIRSGELPEEFMNKPEWQNACKLVLEWVNPDSILYNNILGLWFEFDMIENSSEIPVPCIFLHTTPLRIDTPEDMKKFTWLTDTALPLLTGHHVSENIERQLIQAVQQLPEGAVLMDTGVMLSRSTSGVRLIIARICPAKIIPYLTALGWSDINKEIWTLLKELEQQVTRLVLHINITETGVDSKIGLESSFSPDLYHLETRWSSFFDYLVKKRVCLPEKKGALLQFSGVEQENPSYDFNLTSYKAAARLSDSDFSSALVRYISHIKFISKPNSPLEAKAYSGVRLFGRPYKSTGQSLEGIY
ncbi:MAG: hypothetical protein NTZ75_06295 [Euryarchaeota archaeon]|nr:hypothetical protein [Euryarchaeota archaeon]